MACGANYAWGQPPDTDAQNREVFENTLRMSPREVNMRLVYDVCHKHCQIDSFNSAVC
jgi:tRNA-splicing ligase RtcB